MKISIALSSRDPQSPAFKRLTAIKSAFESAGVTAVWAGDDGAEAADLVYLSFPPFPRLIQILKIVFSRKPFVIEYRDGWSDSIFSGYGDPTQAKKWKAFLVRRLERFLNWRAIKIVTVTPGLVRAHNNEKIVLLPNGSEIHQPTPFKRVDLSKNVLRAVCFGKFQSYGTKNVIQALEVIANRYAEKFIEIDVFSRQQEDAQIEHSFKNIRVRWCSPIVLENPLRFFSQYDLGLTIIRDERFDFGTKIFDYAQIGLPIIHCFSSSSDLSYFFSGSFDIDMNSRVRSDYSRAAILKEFGFESFVAELRQNVLKKN